MDDERARALLQDERVRVQRLLGGADAVGRSDRQAADEDAGSSDAAELLTSQGTDDALAAELRDRLAALDRAEERLEAGTFGRSIRSGQTIPDDRLEADPAAELTVEEANRS
ncbi:MAG: DnaK suppressor protein [Actinomycetota bacterium]|jgi:DnaK suppressor protein|nr:DnaK suppressor protein [Actinomycetota bacterium]